MGTRQVVIAAAVVTMAVAFVAFFLAQATFGGGAGAPATPTPEPTTETGRLGAVHLGNVAPEPVAVTLTVRRNGQVVYDGTVELPAGEQSGPGAYEGTSVGIRRWRGTGEFEVTVEARGSTRRATVTGPGCVALRLTVFPEGLSEVSRSDCLLA